MSELTRITQEDQRAIIDGQVCRCYLRAMHKARKSMARHGSASLPASTTAQIRRLRHERQIRKLLTRLTDASEANLSALLSFEVKEGKERAVITISPPKARPARP